MEEVISIVQVQFSWWERLWLAAFSALLVATCSYATSIILRKQERKSAAIQNVLKEFLDQLDLLDSLINEYYGIAPASMRREQELVLGEAIFTAIRRLPMILSLLFALKGQKERHRSSDLQTCIDTVYESATRNINVKSRQVGRTAIAQISEPISSLRIKLQTYIYLS